MFILLLYPLAWKEVDTLRKAIMGKLFFGLMVLLPLDNLITALHLLCIHTIGLPSANCSILFHKLYFWTLVSVTTATMYQCITYCSKVHQRSWGEWPHIKILFLGSVRRCLGTLVVLIQQMRQLTSLMWMELLILISPLAKKEEFPNISTL